MLSDASQVFFLVMKVFAFYFAAISLFGLFRAKGPRDTDRRMKFAVLVPARNEEACIHCIVDSMKRQDYPPELIDTYVIPNNCTDNTREAALAAGARIIDVSPRVKNKGAALHEAIARLMEMDYDAFCVFDADNEADPGFIAAMNRTLCSGARVAKSRILSKNRGDGWVCACYDIHFCFANLFLNRARETLGLSARLIGTGFAMSRDFIADWGGFNTETITEDAELYAICAAAGEHIAFCEEAVTYDEEPTGFGLSLVQRRRWMSGIMQVTWLKGGELCRSLFRGRRPDLAFDALLQLLFSYIQALMPLALLAALATNLTGFITTLPITLALGYGGALTNALLSLALSKRLSRRMLRGLLMYPIFAASFIPLATISLFRQTKTWKPIPHTGRPIELKAER